VFFGLPVLGLARVGYLMETNKFLFAFPATRMSASHYFAMNIYVAVALQAVVASFCYQK
jgi:hypothetical protein